MTIRKGQPWGTTTPRPDQMVVARTDRELAELATNEPGSLLTVSGGDLFDSVGAPPVRDPVQRLPIDMLRIEADGESHRAVAHVVARRSWWRGSIVAVLNVDHVGHWNVAPRAHPNDGRFDVVEVDRAMSIRQRWQAGRRLPQGTHVPHPKIVVRTGSRESWRFDRPHRLFVDGEHVGSVRHFTVVVEPDAFTILV